MKKNASLILRFLFSILIIQISNEKFLQFDTKSNCPNSPLTSFGVFLSIEEKNDDYSKKIKSNITQSERESYEDIIDLKRSFSSTISEIPQSFSPEKDDYWDGLDSLFNVFIIIAIFPTAFIIFYLFVRFVLKKCTGPKKISQVNKMYRNTTWVIMITSSIITAILFAVVLGKSVAVGNNIQDAFDYSVIQISSVSYLYPEINKLVEENRENSTSLPNKEFMNKFKVDIETYISDTRDRSQQILDDESKRTKITAFVFAAYYLLVILAFLFFFIRQEKCECVVSIILFFAVPSIIILEGYNAKFFFFYGDLCDSVNGAIYKDEFPVADQSLGYYCNCFPKETKRNFYNIRYRLYENINNTDPDYILLDSEIKNTLVNCNLVKKIVPHIEKEFCKDSLDHMYTLIEIMTWIALTSLGVAIGARRLQVLIWKKRNEIESMMQNEEVMF